VGRMFRSFRRSLQFFIGFKKVGMDIVALAAFVLVPFFAGIVVGWGLRWKASVIEERANCS
jgi:hypothetical protein